MANSLTFNDIATVLNSIHNIVTGTTNLAPTNTNEFVNVATTTLLQGYDPVLKAISQVMSKTIFSIRPYYAKFPGLEVSNDQYGNHVRKLQMLDSEWTPDVSFTLTDGQSVDMYPVKRDAVLQTNFYGIETFARFITIFKNQLDNAFTGPEQLAQFMTMKMTNLTDQIEQTKESTARMTICNSIAGKTIVDPGNVVHLVTLYNSYLGLSDDEAYTTETIRNPATWKDFVYWAFSKMADFSDYLTDRTAMYHIQLTPPTGAKTGTLMRHTPKRDQRAYFLTTDMNQIAARVRTSTFHNNFLEMVAHETINFWNSPKSPNEIKVVPSYTGTDGTVKVADAAVALTDVFGVIFDREQMGMTTVWNEMAPTPYNVRGSYSNIWAKYDMKWWNDWTENMVLFVLD